MAIDGFFIKKLIEEIKPILINNRVQKIGLNKKDFFVFDFYYRKEENILNIKLNPPYASMFLSNRIEIDKTLSSNFLINLNKNLIGYILTNITQYKNDRVIILEFSGNDLLEGKITKTLIVEFMGRYNNMILLKDNIIIDAYNKNVSQTNRSIVPKLQYSFFPSNKLDFDGDFINIESETYLSKKYIGFSPLLSKHLYYNNDNFENIKVNATLNLNDNKFYWFDLFDSSNKVHFKNINVLLEHLVIDSFNIKDNKYLNFLNKKLVSSEKKLYNLKSDLEKSLNNLLYKDYGNYIYSSGLNLNSFYSEFTTYDNKLIKLDSSINLLDNAKKYFKIYEKSKRSVEHLNNQIIELENLITVLKEIEYEISNSLLSIEEMNLLLKPFGFKTKVKKQNNKKINKHNILKIEYNNSLFLVGKNNIQNEYILTELANHNDYWFHIKDNPGSHIVLKGELNNLNLEFGSMLAAFYSKEKNNPIISVNYTKIKDLKKIPGLPAYNVILKQYKTINIKINKDLLTNYIIAN